MDFYWDEYTIFKSNGINNMVNTHVSGTEPSSVFEIWFLEYCQNKLNPTLMVLYQSVQLKNLLHGQCI